MSQIPPTSLPRHPKHLDDNESGENQNENRERILQAPGRKLPVKSELIAGRSLDINGVGTVGNGHERAVAVIGGAAHAAVETGHPAGIAEIGLVVAGAYAASGIHAAEITTCGHINAPCP